jgi:hypothetical protein
MFYRKTQIAYVRKYDIVSVKDSTGEKVGAVVDVYHMPDSKYGSQFAARVDWTEEADSDFYDVFDLNLIFCYNNGNYILP